MSKARELTSKVVCPYCGYEKPDSWSHVNISEGRTGETNCARCKRDYYVTPVITTEYLCSPIIDDDEHRNQERGRL